MYKLETGDNNQIPGYMNIYLNYILTLSAALLILSCSDGSNSSNTPIGNQQSTQIKASGVYNGMDVNDVIRISDGSYAVLSRVEGWGTGGRDCGVTKLSSSFDVQWSKLYGLSSVDEGIGITAMPGGGFLITGFTYIPPQNQSVMWVLNLDANGSVIWSKELIGGGYNSMGFKTACSTDNYCFIGFQISSGNPDCIMKIDGSGNIIWAKQYLYSGDIADMDILASGDLIVLSTYHGSYSQNVVSRISSDGTLLWNYGYTLDGQWISSKCYVSPDDNIYVCGNIRNSSGNQIEDGLVYKLNSIGEMVWTRSVGAGNVELLNDVIQTSAGDVIAFGSTQSYNYGVSSGFVVSFTSDGTFKHAFTVLPSGGYYYHTGFPLPDGSYTACGRVSLPQTINENFCFTKFRSDGSLCSFAQAVTPPVHNLNMNRSGGVSQSSTISGLSLDTFSVSVTQFQLIDSVFCRY